jgi:hypothetical protein
MARKFPGEMNTESWPHTGQLPALPPLEPVVLVLLELLVLVPEPLELELLELELVELEFVELELLELPLPDALELELVPEVLELELVPEVLELPSLEPRVPPCPVPSVSEPLAFASVN